MAWPLIDVDAATHFLELLGKNGDARFRAFPHKHTPNERKARLGARKPLNLRELQLAQDAGLGAYLVINRGGDSKGSITDCIAYFAEFDGQEEADQLRQVQQSGLPEPSLIVRTGGGSLHFYWLLAEPMKDTAQWQADMKRLAARLGSDKSVNDPSRVMRVPGCWYMDGNQRPVALVELIHESSARYTRDQIVSCLPAPQQAPRKAKSPQSPKHPVKRPAAGSERTAERALDQLKLIPPRIPGTNTRDQYLRLLWGLAHILGSDEAGAAMASHSPEWAVVEDLVAKAGEADGRITDGTFFEVAKGEFGITDPAAAEGRTGGGGHQGSAAADLSLSTYGELLDQTLNAIREGSEDSEMQARAELKNRFRISDEQIGTALFKRYSAGRIKAVDRVHDSVDLSRVEALDYLLDGWIPRGDVSLTYGPFGTGKTTLAVLKAYCYAKGINLLDRSTTCTPGRSLFIATDSGAAALKKAFSDLGIDPDTDPLLKPGSPTQSIWIWAYEPDQGHDAWICDIHGVIRLEKFIQEKGITYVPIDSAKSVSAAAGWSYTANESVKALLKFLREGICQPFGCCIDFLSHDGSEKGASSGAKAWAEDPSMVCSLSLSKGENGEPDAVKVEFRKDRAAVVDARRTLSYRLIDQAVELVPGSEIVGNCEEAIATVLWEAHQRDIESITTAALMDECWARFKKSRKTVENTLGRIAGTGKGPTPTPVIRPRKGHLSLSPREIQRRSAVTGSPNRGVGEMGGVNRKAPAPQGICPTPIATPDRGVRGLAQPPLKSVGGWEGGGQTPVTTGDLLATPPSGGMAPPKTGSSWDLDDGDDPHWPPRPLEPQPDDDPNRPF